MKGLPGLTPGKAWLLCQAARVTPGILAEPGHFVVQSRLNDFHISYDLTA